MISFSFTFIDFYIYLSSDSQTYSPRRLLGFRCFRVQRLGNKKKRYFVFATNCAGFLLSPLIYVCRYIGWALTYIYVINFSRRRNDDYDEVLLWWIIPRSTYTENDCVILVTCMIKTSPYRSTRRHHCSLSTTPQTNNEVRWGEYLRTRKNSCYHNRSKFCTWSYPAAQ